jgi:hypothetical protein
VEPERLSERVGPDRVAKGKGEAPHGITDLFRLRVDIVLSGAPLTKTQCWDDFCTTRHTARQLRLIYFDFGSLVGISRAQE